MEKVTSFYHSTGKSIVEKWKKKTDKEATCKVLVGR